MHNQTSTCANMMGKLVAGVHKSILPSAAGHTALPITHCPQQQQPAYHWLSIAHMLTQGPAPPPAYYTRMPPARGAYDLQRTNMAFPAQALVQVINFVGKYPPGVGIVPMMPQSTQKASQMMTPYFAPNQQPYQAQYQANQQQQGYYF